MPMKDYIDEEETRITLNRVIDGLKNGDPLTPRKNATEPPDPDPTEPSSEPSPKPRI